MFVVGEGVSGIPNNACLLKGSGATAKKFIVIIGGLYLQCLIYYQRMALRYNLLLSPLFNPQTAFLLHEKDYQ